MGNRSIQWTPVFTREGFPYFILSLGLEGYVRDMKKALGWGYRDQLFISEKDIEKSYFSERDSRSFLRFLHSCQGRTINQLNSKIRRIFAKRSRQIRRIYMQLEKNLATTVLSELLIEFYKYYREMYSVYRFPTLVDTHRHAFTRATIADCGYTKDYCGKTLTWIDDTVIPAFAASLGVTLRLEKKRVMFMNCQELVESLRRNRSVVSASELEKRYRLYALQAIGGKIQLFIGQRAKQIQKQVEREVPGRKSNDVDALHGQTAYAARKPVIGIARVVRTLRDLKKIRGRYVIVTPMTTVRFSQYLRNAKTIITDEGGLTCHAAIVARELKIPCIVGTKFATKVFKDGDRVEVDATKGIVRKI